MKTEFKVLLYLKRNGQGKDGLCPLMGRIMIKATGNSTTQFGCKIRVARNCGTPPRNGVREKAGWPLPPTGQ